MNPDVLTRDLAHLPPTSLTTGLSGPVTSAQRISTKSKSTVWVLTLGSGRYIAKRALRTTIDCERYMYEAVLPLLGVEAPTVRGWEAESADIAWLLVDFIPGRRPDLGDPNDLGRVSRWVARMHAMSRARGIPPLPNGARRPRPVDRLAELTHAISEARGERSPTQDERGWATSACEELSQMLPLVERASSEVPSSLVHGDLLDNWNVILTDRGVVGVDWDHATWGSPAIDLGVIDVTAYVDEVQRLGGDADPEGILRARAAGVILSSLAHNLPAKPWKSQRKYIERMLRELRKLESEEGVWNG